MFILIGERIDGLAIPSTKGARSGEQTDSGGKLDGEIRGVTGADMAPERLMWSLVQGLLRLFSVGVRSCPRLKMSAALLMLALMLFTGEQGGPRRFWRGVDGSLCDMRNLSREGRLLRVDRPAAMLPAT